MFSIAPIGSCRINTPLRLMRSAFGYEVNKARSYGFTHTSAEAVQQVRFIKGEYTPSPDSWNLIARGKDFREFIDTPPASADFYVVEISSLKRLTLGDDCIQLNYLVNEFREFFADKNRSKEYWRLVSGDDQEAIDRFLSQQWSAHKEQESESAILGRIRRSLMTEDDIRSDIRFLIQNLPRVLFITHVDARKPDGEVIASRSRLIDMVTRIVVQEGGEFYNPTARMLEIGQETAIEDHSDSLAHYTEEFSELIFNDWYETSISRAFDEIALETGAEVFSGKVYPHFQALVEYNYLKGVPERLNKLVDAGITTPELFSVLAQVNEMAGSNEAALESLQLSLKENPGHLPTLQACSDLLINMGRCADAVEVVDALKDVGGSVCAESLYSLANQLRDKGIIPESARFATLTLQENNNHVLAASLLADLAIEHPELVDLKESPVSALLVSTLPPSKLLQAGIELIDTRDESSVADFIEAYTQDEVLEYVEALLEEEHTATAAGILSMLQASNPGNLKSLQLTDNRLFLIAEKWLAVASSECSLVKRAGLIGDLAVAFPMLREVRLADSDTMRDILAQIRAFYNEKDLEGLIGLHESLPQCKQPIFKLEFLLSRLLYSNGKYEAAMAAAKRATEIQEEHLLSRVILMRSAFKCDALELAEQSARKIIALNEPDSERLVDEAQLMLSRIPGRALVVSRSCDAPVRKFRLLHLARRDSSITDKTDIQLERLQRDWLRLLIAAEKSGEGNVVDMGIQLDAHFPGIQRVQLILGRNLVKQGDFASAKIHWLRLLALEPDNADYQFQLERCLQRIAA